MKFTIPSVKICMFNVNFLSYELPWKLLELEIEFPFKGIVEGFIFA